jgi:hypothetical protein
MTYRAYEKYNSIEAEISSYHDGHLKAFPNPTGHLEKN